MLSGSNTARCLEIQLETDGAYSIRRGTTDDYAAVLIRILELMHEAILAGTVTTKRYSAKSLSMRKKGLTIFRI